MSSLNVAAFKALLFGNQTLEDLAIDVETPSQRVSASTLKQLVNAQSYLRQNDEEEAVKCLKSICASTDAGTRPKLWSWFNLRRFGILPEASDGAVVRGVVLEVRVKGGVDVLAAYEDHSARYLNYTGKLIAWDLGDQEIDGLCKNALLVAGRVLEFSTKDYTENPQLSLLRVTLLTFNGNHRIEGDPNASTPGNAILGQLLKGGAMLMNALINRTKTMNALVQPPPGSGRR
jgi:hypothetical protein